MHLSTFPWMVFTQMMICSWEGHLVSLTDLAYPTLPLCRPQCLAARTRKFRYFVCVENFRVILHLCAKHSHNQYICGKTKGKCPNKGHQAHHKIAKEVRKSGYYQPATSWTVTILGSFSLLVIPFLQFLLLGSS
jgi:hypothetical protein